MVNKVLLIGNLGDAPELRYTQGGTPVATFSMATTERRKGNDGQVQDHTEWHRCVAWNRLAEICGEYLAKGSKVYVEGRLQTHKWKDKSGVDRYTTEVVIWEMKMLDGKRNESTGESNIGGGYSGEYQGAPMGDDVPF